MKKLSHVFGGRNVDVLIGLENVEWNERARAIGGFYVNGSRAWRFDAVQVDEVRELLSDLFAAERLPNGEWAAYEEVPA